MQRASKKKKVSKWPTHKQLRSLGNISILRPNDVQFDFFEDLKEEIEDSGMDQIEKAFVAFPRVEMCKIIFQLCDMQSMFPDDKLASPIKK